MGILTTALLMNLVSVLALATTLQPAKTSFCTLASEGLAINAWAKHRILIADELVYGTNNMSSNVEKLHTLRNQGLCQ